jgi:hypothetical protein
LPAFQAINGGQYMLGCVLGSRQTYPDQTPKSGSPSSEGTHHLNRLTIEGSPPHHQPHHHILLLAFISDKFRSEDQQAPPTMISGYEMGGY